jgi:hypothetical protein
MPPNDDHDLEELARNTLLDDDEGEVYRQSEGPRLRVVGGTEKPRTKAKPSQLRRGATTELFARAPEKWLLATDCPLPRCWRLYFLLQIRSAQGARRVRVTNELAATVGLTSPATKMRQLRALRKLGLLVVTGDGQQAPSVTLQPIPGWAPRVPK